VINAGVQVQGVIIADDGRRAEPPPTPARPKVTPARPKAPPSSNKTMTGEWIGTALVSLICIAGVIGLIVLATISLFYVLIPLVILGLFTCAGGNARAFSSDDYDPKLVVLVDDGNGGTAWVSLFTWYE